MNQKTWDSTEKKPTQLRFEAKYGQWDTISLQTQRNYTRILGINATLVINWSIK
jgi:hypothetical protein